MFSSASMVMHKISLGIPWYSCVVTSCCREDVDGRGEARDLVPTPRDIWRPLFLDRKKKFRSKKTGS